MCQFSVIFIQESGNATHEAIVTGLTFAALDADAIAILPDGAVPMVVCLDLIIGIQCEAEKNNG